VSFCGRTRNPGIFRRRHWFLGCHRPLLGFAPKTSRTLGHHFRRRARLRYGRRRAHVSRRDGGFKAELLRHTLRGRQREWTGDNIQLYAQLALIETEHLSCAEQKGVARCNWGHRRACRCAGYTQWDELVSFLLVATDLRISKRLANTYTTATLSPGAATARNLFPFRRHPHYLVRATATEITGTENSNNTKLKSTPSTPSPIPPSTKTLSPRLVRMGRSTFGTRSA